MINPKIEKALNEQVEKETYSSHLYLAMASWAETEGLKGVAEWMYAQADEERIHQLKFIKYINERGGKAKISAIKTPPVSFKSVKVVFAEVYKHEQYITASINDLVALCVAEKDYTTNNWLQWFVTEQIEEEASVSDIIDRLKIMGDHNLYMFDRDIMVMRAAAAAANAQGA
ncbi:MAG: ferritin [Bacteroidetes bacterium]|nr:ferritin [Bacteroidota bacterium]MBU1720127.1 ferritin [Bacteroidota bacterium]